MDLELQTKGLRFMGYLVVIGCYILLGYLSSNPSLLLVLIAMGVLIVLFRLQAKKTESKAKFEREKLFQAEAAERAEQKRLDAIEARRVWEIELDKQQKSRIERVNRSRERFSIVSEVCGVCGSELNPKGICVSDCKPLEE
jgi:flagellar biosynthesis component FlhA